MWCREEDLFKPSTGMFVRHSPGRDVRDDLTPFSGGSFLCWVTQLEVTIRVTVVDNSDYSDVPVNTLNTESHSHTHTPKTKITYSILQ